MTFQVFLDFHEFFQNNFVSVYKAHYGEVKIERIAKESAWNKCTMHKTLAVGILEWMRQF